MQSNQGESRGRNIDENRGRGPNIMPNHFVNNKFYLVNGIDYQITITYHLFFERVGALSF